MATSYIFSPPLRRWPRVGWPALLALLLGLLNGPAALAQTPPAYPPTGYRWAWASQPTNNAGEAEILSVSTDAAGATAVGGAYTAACTLGGTALPQPNSQGLGGRIGNVLYGPTSGFVGRLTAVGTWQWVQPVGSAATNAVVQQVVLAPNGNTYVVGSLLGTFAFGSTTLNCPTDAGAFVACLNPAGQWLWAVQAHYDDIVSTTVTTGLALAVGTVGNATVVYALGTFNGRSIFGSNSFANLITPYQHKHLWAARLDGATGAFQWVRQLGPPTAPAADYSSVAPDHAAVDAQGNLFFSGKIYSVQVSQFGLSPAVVLTPGGGDMLLGMLSPAGVVRWVRNDASFDTQGRYAGLGLTTTGSVVVAGHTGNRYSINGYILGNPAYRTQFGNLAPLPQYQPFLGNLSTSGAWQWTTAPFAASAPNALRFEGLAQDPASGELYVAGTFGGTVSIGSRSWTSVDVSDAFFARLSAQAVPLDGYPLGGSQGDFVNGLALGAGNAPVLAGALYSASVVGVPALSKPANDRVAPWLARATVVPAPTVTAVSPSIGAVGATVTITGTDFYNVDAVRVGTEWATAFTVVSATQLTATVPAQGPGAGPTQVNTFSGIGLGPVFTVVMPPTGITFSPGFGAVGTAVTLRGTGFTGATLVKFGGTTTTNFSIISDQEIRVNVPSMGVSLVKISVVNPAGTGISAANFGVGIAPTISSITPNRGAAGTTFSVSGAALGGATSVKIGAVPCAILTNTATAITARVPNTLTGAVNVTTPYGTAFGPFFTPTAPAPTITLFAPASGPMGTSVNIAGTNLDWVTNAAVNGVAAPITAQTATSLTLTVPDASTGRITLTGPGGTATSVVDFVVPTPPAPAWAWAQKTTGLGSYQNATGVTTDLQGNTYVVGDFSLQATFGAHTIASQGTSDAYVAKQAPNGTWLWAVRLGGYGNDAAYAVRVLPGGRLVVVGYFEQTMTVGATSATSAGETDAFAAFLNLDGTGRTVYRGGSARGDVATAVAAQPDGTTWVVGTVAQNSGAGTAFSFGPAGGVSLGNGDVFLARLTETTGFTSVLSAGGSGADVATGVAVSAAGRIAVVGSFRNYFALGYSAWTARGGTDTFVATTSIYGNAAAGGWTGFTLDASTADDAATGAAFDGEDLLVSGTFGGTLTNYGATPLLTSAGGTDGYVLRYRAGIGFSLDLQTATRLGGAGNDEARALAVDAAGNATVTGFYEGAVPFGPTVLTAQTGVNAARDLYVARLSAAGQWTWAASAGTTNQYDEGHALTLDAAGNTVVAGVLTPTRPAAFGALPPLTTQNGLFTAKIGTATVPAPTLTGLTPTSGPRGTVVTVTGTNLQTVNDIEFVGGPDYVNYADISAISNTALTFAVPAGATTGAIRVTTAGGTAQTPGAFTVTGPTNVVFAPATGLPGTLVTILGVGFANVTAVRFGGVALPAANYTVESATTIRAYVAASSATGPVSVQTAVGTGTSAASFTVIPAPTITGFSPLSGPVGSTVTISGTGFANLTAVKLGALAVASYVVVNPTTLTAVVPTGALSSQFSVEAGGTTTAAFGTPFTVTQPVPTISGFTPASGPVGTTVTITGTSFTSASAVSFNNLDCPAGSWTVQSATAIVANVPATATTGRIRVTTPGGTAVSATDFTVTSPPAAPTLTGFTPGSGPVGTSVTLTGTNLDQATGVTFNGTAATIQTFNSTQLTVTVPAGATTGALAVTTPGGSATAPGTFSVTVPSASGWPTSVTSSGSSQAMATVTDAAGNVYVAGFFNGTASFGGLSATTASQSGFVVKYNSAGVGQWVRAIGDAGQVAISGLDVDANGSVYLAGTFYDAITYPQGGGTATLPNPNGTTRRGFVGQLSNAGAIQFLTGFGGTQPTEVRDVVVDLNGVVYVGGMFQQSLGFDLNSQLVLSGSGPTDGFIVALNTGTGQWAWVRRCGGAGSDDLTGLAIDLNAQALYACGTFESGSFTLTGVQQPLSNLGSTDLWVARLTTNGVGQWAAGGASNGGDYARDVAVSPQGTVYVAVTGFATGTLGANTLPTTNVFGYTAVARLSAGGAWLTGVALAGGGTSVSFSNYTLVGRLAVAADGAATVAGFGVGQTLFGATTLTGVNNYYGVVARTTAAATGWQWAQMLTDGSVANQSYATAVALRPASTDAYVVGMFNGALTLDGTTLTTGAFVNNAYAARISAPAGPPAAPTVTNLSPNFGPTGTSITFTGTHLTGATAVSFNGATATFSNVTATSLTATVPAAATSGPVSVTTPGGAVSGPAFLVTASQPVITSFSPPSGPAGTSVTLSGQHLGLATDVRFNGVSATITGNTATLLTCAVPAGATDGPISVTTSGGTGSSATAFDVTGAPVNTPVISAIAPLHGPEGSQVTISGQYLTTATQVRFNGMPASFYVSGSNLIAQVPIGATSGIIAVTTPVDDAGSPQPFELDLLILGNQIAAFGLYYDVTVAPNATLTLGGAALGVSHAMLVRSGATVDFAGGVVIGNGTFTSEANTTLVIRQPEGLTLTPATQGDVQLTGARTYAADADYEYAGGAQQTGAALPATVRNLTIGGGTVTLTNPLGIRRVLRLPGAGNLLTAGRMLTLLSDATATAMLVNGGTGRVVGTATVERFITADVAPGVGYRQLSSPVQATTVADLAVSGASGFAPLVNPAYNALPTPSLPAAQFPNVLGYDETRGGPTALSFTTGYYSPAALTSVLTPGRGYSVAMRPVKPDFVGELTQNELTISGLTRTGTPLATGDKPGFHLLGNPYASPLDWDLVPVPAGLSPALFVWKTQGGNNGVYLTRTNGIGSLQDGVLPMGQAFWVQVTGTGPVDLTLPTAARTTTYDNPIRYRAGASTIAPDQRPRLTLALGAPGAPAHQRDQAFIYAEAGATPNLDSRFDAVKPGLNVGIPTLATRTPAGDELAINGLPEATLTQGATVPLLLAVPTAGAYELTATLLNLADTEVALTDALTGTSYDLHQQPTVKFTAAQAGEVRNRFRLVFGQRTLGHSSFLIPHSSFTLWPNPAHGTVRLSGLTVGAPVTLLDATGRVVRTLTPLTDGADLSLTDLAPGVYVVRAGAATHRLVVE